MNITLIIQIATFIVGIAVLILLHEFGHFLASRLFKVQVDEFGLGFPPRAAKLFRLGGTDFTLNWIPLGGFVRPKGENDPSVEGGLAAANPWVRIAVYIAGPATNLLIGVLLGVILFYNIGKPITNKVLIEQVIKNTPAEQVGLQAGDLIVSINGAPIDSMETLHRLVSENLGKSIAMVYQRGEQLVTVSLIPRENPPEGEGSMGIVMSNPRQPISIFEAFTQGATATYENVRGILVLPMRMMKGEATPEEGRLVGYKGMFQIYQQIINPLWFFMAISISLGVINLLPIPALDGGRMLLTLPEILFRKRIPPAYENVIHLVGFALLLFLLIYINVQDFINPIVLPK
jgi:regulator of sigma E protease